MGNELIVRDPAKLEAWAKRIASCKSSGETVAEWCHQNGIRIKTYYYWNRKIVRMTAMNSHPTGFYEIPNMQDASNCRDIVSTVSAGALKADIYRGADEETLIAILRAIRRC